MDKDQLVADLFKVGDDPWPDEWHRATAIQAAFYISGKTPADDPTWFSITERPPTPNIEIWLWKDGACWMTAIGGDDKGADLPATHWKPA